MTPGDKMDGKLETKAELSRDDILAKLVRAAGVRRALCTADQRDADGTRDVERLVPPEAVHEYGDGGVRERHDLELRHREMFDAARDALDDEPQRLYDGDGLGDRVRFPAILELSERGRDEGALLDEVQHIVGGQGGDRLVVLRPRARYTQAHHPDRYTSASAPLRNDRHVGHAGSPQLPYPPASRRLDRIRALKNWFMAVAKANSGAMSVPNTSPARPKPQPPSGECTLRCTATNTQMNSVLTQEEMMLYKERQLLMFWHRGEVSGMSCSENVDIVPLEAVGTAEADEMVS
ncbi:hypothetical protein HWV62_17070 [Athelia sp. TMB]|nr:hypothetical protein HWV62_17070 [Athelia sp. TMB]